ncbi:MAG: hypothetical protein K0S45_3467 [Nitrospira sp.]|nr:hypothetical protein [Nitrospira sp.]
MAETVQTPVHNDSVIIRLRLAALWGHHMALNPDRRNLPIDFPSLSIEHELPRIPAQVKFNGVLFDHQVDPFPPPSRRFQLRVLA